MSGFELYGLTAGAGTLALSPMPGASGDFEGDMVPLLHWAPDHVVTLTEEAELKALRAATLGARLAAAGITWHHHPIRDFGTPDAAFLKGWPAVSAGLRAALARGGRVLVHCRGGCGRSGMVVLRLLNEMGEDPAAALIRLRAARPCAVETDEQATWAMSAV